MKNLQNLINKLEDKNSIELTIITLKKTDIEIEKFIDSQNSDFKGIKRNNEKYNQVFNEFKQLFDEILNKE